MAQENREEERERNGESVVYHYFFPKNKVNRPARNYKIKVNVVIFTFSNI